MIADNPPFKHMLWLLLQGISGLRSYFYIWYFTGHRMPDALLEWGDDGALLVGNRTHLKIRARNTCPERGFLTYPELCLCYVHIWYVQVQVQVQRVSCCFRAEQGEQQRLGRGWQRETGPSWGQVTMSRTHISCHSSVYFLTSLYFAFIASLLTRALRYCYCNCCCSPHFCCPCFSCSCRCMLQLPAGNRSLSRQRSCMWGCEESVAKQRNSRGIICE